MERRFYIDRRAVFRGGMKLPLRYRLAGKPIEAVVHAAQHAHVADSAVGADDCVKDHRAGDVLAHEL